MGLRNGAPRCRRAVRQIYRRERKETAKSPGVGAKTRAHGAVDRRNRESLRLRGQQRRCRRRLVPEAAGYATDLDARSRGRRLPGGDLKQYLGSAAGNAAEEPLR